MVEEEESGSSSWSWEQDKAFENALATVSEDAPDRWEQIAAAVSEKSVEDVKHHYEILIKDINGIESGRVTLPNYASSVENSGGQASEISGKASRLDQERRKGIAWTEDEHRLFLLGLDKYGKGDWRSISRNFVISRTPTQVASHAQKYFIRLNSMNKDRRRSSIHDITNPGGSNSVNPSASSSQVPITGQTNGQAVGSAPTPGKPVKAPAQLHAGTPSVSVYGGTTIGQPVAGPLVSAVGTPVNLPVAAVPHHVAYGVRAPVAGAVFPGTQMIGMSPMLYSMPPASAHP